MKKSKTIITLAAGILIGTAIAAPAAQAAGSWFRATPSTQQFFVDGRKVQLEAYTLVLEDIRHNARWAAVAERDYAQLLIGAKQSQQKAETDRQRRELKKAEKRLGELDKILNKLYEDRALEKITEERYQSMVSGYEQEHTSLLEKKKSLVEAISASEQVYDDVDAFLPLVRQYTDLQELNARILNELIEKIVVHEKERDEEGNVTQQLDIHYKFIGYIDPKTVMEGLLSPTADTEGAKPVVFIP